MLWFISQLSFLNPKYKFLQICKVDFLEDDNLILRLKFMPGE